MLLFFATLAGLSAETNYQLWFGEYGQYGKFQITGESNVWINAGGVNNVVEMMFDIFPTDESSKIARVVDIAGTYGVSYEIVAGEPVMDFSSATKQTGTNEFYVNVLRSYKPHLNDWDSAFAEASGWYTGRYGRLYKFRWDLFQQETRYWSRIPQTRKLLEVHYIQYQKQLGG